MNTTLDQVLKELQQQSDDLQFISQQLSELAENNQNLFYMVHMVQLMAEKMATISYPGFLAYPDVEKEKIINDIAYYCIKQDKTFIERKGK